MSNINVLVIDSNQTVTKEVVKYFSSHEVINVVGCKNDGEEGLSYILNNVDEIDAIVMDIILPRIDGLFLLQELKNRKIYKNVIITTSFNDDNILEEANSLGIDYYMMKPINYLALEKRLLSLKKKNGRNKTFNITPKVTDILHNLGIPSHISGFNYIRDGIILMYKSSRTSNRITKDIYPELAKKYETTPSRVERAIRHAIEVSWERGDIELMDEIFGNSLNINRDKPTNSEFIATISDKLKVNNNVITN